MPASSSGESGLNESEKVASLRALLLCAPPRINPAPYGAHLALCLTSSTALGRILRPMLERSMRPMLTKFQLYLSLERLSSTLTLCAYSLRLLSALKHYVRALLGSTPCVTTCDSTSMDRLFIIVPICVLGRKIDSSAKLSRSKINDGTRMTKPGSSLGIESG